MNKIVIGVGFGDEGKGLFTDYLCSRSPNPLVIRFSGGHQAGHTVVTDNVRHVFSNFGSGTLRNAPTYWSKYCTIEPIGLLKELKILQEKGINPLLYIDERCAITTPLDIIFNQGEEVVNSHGSCGVGYGATIRREEHYYSLTFMDLFYPDVFKAKLKAIQNFYKIKEDLTEFIERCQSLISKSNIIRTFSFPIKKFDNYIFEGSQGLLLDQHFGFFPHVTRSNIGCKNVVDLLIEKNCIKVEKSLEIYLITRAYQTRHGNGFMSNDEILYNGIIDNPLETNQDNKYQGKFRKAMLDLSLIEYAITKDEYIKKSNRKNLVITCLDHLYLDYRFTYRNKVYYYTDEESFVTTISTILNISNVYLSGTNNSKNITKVK